MHPGTSSCNQVHQDASRYIKLQPSTLRCIQVHQATIKYIKAQVVPWCTNTFLWMPKMNLDAAGCSIWPSLQLDVLDVYWCSMWFTWMLKMTLDAAGCLGCQSMYNLCSEVPLGFIWMPLIQLDVLDVYGCPRWPTKQLEVLELHWCIHFALMHQGIYMDDQDDPWCIWMSIVAQVVSRCTKGFIWMLKMTL